MIHHRERLPLLFEPGNLYSSAMEVESAVQRRDLAMTSRSGRLATSSPIWHARRVFPWLRRFTYAFSEIDPYIVRRRRRPALLRPYQPSDYEACINLYKVNEPGRFPSGGLPKFEESLLGSSGAAYVMVENAGQIVGCGGVCIQFRGKWHAAQLCFGLIDPAHHRQGFGSVLLLGRLSLLPAGDWGIFIGTVPTSRRFYEKVGFQPYRVGTEDGLKLTHHYGHLRELDRQLCKRLLQDAGVELRLSDIVVPQTEVTLKTGEDNHPVSA